MPSAHDALDGLIRAYPGGYEAIAQRLGKHPSTLRNEVHPPLGSSAKLGWDTAMQVMGMCQQVGLPAALAPLDAAELAFGRTAMWLPDRAEMEPGAFEALEASATAFARMVGAFSAAVADGRVTAHERRDVEQCGLTLIARVQAIVAYAAAQHAAAMPAALREPA